MKPVLGTQAELEDHRPWYTAGMQTRSRVAEMVGNPQDVTDRRSLRPFGVMVHTTGAGRWLQDAVKVGADPLGAAVDFYCKPKANFAHYVTDWSGTILQVADERERARHAGIDRAERELYKSGDWKAKVGQKALKLWQKSWPGMHSPLDLFPPGSPNEHYIGIELIPLLKRQKDGSRFTREQYKALTAFLKDFQERWGLGLGASRLVGHEDIEPLTRWNKTQGWDPGGLSDRPSFFWDLVL